MSKKKIDTISCIKNLTDKIEDLNILLKQVSDEKINYMEGWHEQNNQIRRKRKNLRRELKEISKIGVKRMSPYK